MVTSIHRLIQLEGFWLPELQSFDPSTAKYTLYSYSDAQSRGKWGRGEGSAPPTRGKPLAVLTLHEQAVNIKPVLEVVGRQRGLKQIGRLSA